MFELKIVTVSKKLPQNRVTTSIERKNLEKTILTLNANSVCAFNFGAATFSPEDKSPPRELLSVKKLLLNIESFLGVEMDPRAASGEFDGCPEPKTSPLS